MFGKIKLQLAIIGIIILGLLGVHLDGKKTGVKNEKAKQNKKLLDAVGTKNSIRNRNRTRYANARKLYKSKRNSSR